MAEATQTTTDDLVPDEVIPHGALPPLRYRDLPEPIPLRKMIGPSIMLAGLALGSGEFIFWPYITYKSQFVFFWACVLGVAIQYFINMEITRWTLATGESAITGFCRQSKHWAGVFLFLNIVPWMIPAWAKGSAHVLSWMVWGEAAPHVTEMAIAGLAICGVILTAGPVIYETVERIQMALVSAILLLVVVLACYLVRSDAVVAQLKGAINFGALPPAEAGLSMTALLGALAFAGVGGTLNLGQSNYVKDKGYGMGRYIGRITSPITGQKEPVAEIGYHFHPTPENLARWRQWWRAASWEHFLTFFLTCLVCIVLLTLICYSVFYQPDGQLRPGAGQYEGGLSFVWGQAVEIQRQLGPAVKALFLVMGIAILLTTEFGVLDAASRISMDIVKVNWLRDSRSWTESRLYYLFLWGTILLGTGILLAYRNEPFSSFKLFKLTAALNGAVMFLYCGALIALNRFKLPRAIRMNRLRLAIMLLAVVFYGTFAAWAGWSELSSLWNDG